MSFPPLPSLSLNVSKLDISELTIKEIDFSKHSIESLYNLFISMFILLLIQTILLCYSNIKTYRPPYKKVLLSGDTI